MMNAMMDDVTKKTIRTIETIETIKHNETVEKRETIQEQSFYLSLLNENSKHMEKDILNKLNEDKTKHALGISFDQTMDDTVKVLANELLHINESAIVKEGEGAVLERETGHVHTADYYMARLHGNGTSGEPGRMTARRP
jgi:hypothetical protein